MKRAGSAVPSANRITLLRDTDGDGIADQRSAFLSTELNSPFGMALVGNQLYVANTDALIRFPYRAGDTAITERRRQGHGPSRRRSSTTTGPRTSSRAPTARSFTSPSARTATWPSTGWRRKSSGQRSWRSIRTPARARSSHRACATRTALPGSRRPAAVDGGQRTRRDRQRPRPGLPHVGPTRRILRLALQLLRTDRR